MGTKISRTQFVSHAQLARSLSMQAKRATGNLRTSLLEQATKSALKGVRLQPRCSRLPPPSLGTRQQLAGETTTSAVGSTPTTEPEPTATTIDPRLLEFPADCPSTPDNRWDIINGASAGYAVQAYACARTRPIVAQGEPIKIGVMNPEGDPAGDFPNFSNGVDAAVAYMNNELGGIGADPATGRPGRPIQISKCIMAISPSDSTRCANEMAATGQLVALSTINFFGNHHSILRADGIPSLVALPISPADVREEGVYSLATNCNVVGTGSASLAASLIGSGLVSVIWANTPPGVFCHHDGFKKPLFIRNGTASGPSPFFNSSPGLGYSGTPLRPGTADPTSTIQGVLQADPRAITVDVGESDCASLIGSLIQSGWDASQKPLIVGTNCGTASTLTALGPSAVGTYVVGQFLDKEPIDTNQLLSTEVSILTTKLEQYGDATLRSDFQNRGFASMMRLYTILGHASRNGGLNRTSVSNTLETVDGLHSFRNPPMSCPDAPAPYIALCANTIRVFRWSGSKLEVVNEALSPLNILAGTSLDFGR